jgi:hypothetical protein
MLCLSYYCLFLLFNGTGEKRRTGSAWKGGVGGEGESGGSGGEMSQTMYSDVNKWIIIKKEIVLDIKNTLCSINRHISYGQQTNKN